MRLEFGFQVRDHLAFELSEIDGEDILLDLGDILVTILRKAGVGFYALLQTLLYNTHCCHICQ